MNIMQNNFSMIAATLAVILTTALLCAPVYAGDYGLSKKPQIRSGPTIGPEVRGVRADDGGPGQKKPGINTGPVKETFIIKLKLGQVNWRIKLVHPVWFPELFVFTKPGLREGN